MKYTGFCNQVRQLTQYEEIIGSSQDIKQLACGGELRKDLQVERVLGTTIWGSLKDCQGQPLGGQLVKLICNCQSESGEYFKVVDQTLTDDYGCYRLDTYGTQEVYYNIIVECEAPISVQVQTEDVVDDCIEDVGEEMPPIIREQQPKSGMEGDVGIRPHQMNVYDYSQETYPYMSIMHHASGKFYGNNTYTYRR
ncbi:MAG: hypothetical protein ACRCTE_11640 [Cellulosilyticaceae bacterium]